MEIRIKVTVHGDTVGTNEFSVHGSVTIIMFLIDNKMTLFDGGVNLMYFSHAVPMDIRFQVYQIFLW